MLSVLSFMTGLYWWKLSHCEHIQDSSISQYTCENRSAYTSVSAFSFILFVVELGCACIAFLWRTDLIDELGRYAEIDDALNNLPTFNPYSNSPKIYGREIYGRIEERSAEL